MSTNNDVSKVKLYPPEFVSSLADIASQTLHDWLIENKLPQEVIDLASEAVMLERYTNELESGKIYESDMRELADNLPNILECIAKLGGVFSTESLQGVRRENVITLQPKEEGQ